MLTDKEIKQEMKEFAKTIPVLAASKNGKKEQFKKIIVKKTNGEFFIIAVYSGFVKAFLVTGYGGKLTYYEFKRYKERMYWTFD
jgi:hypothetical protein